MMPARRRHVPPKRLRPVPAALIAGIVAALTTVTPSAAQSVAGRISGEGSSWAAPAIDSMRVNVETFGIIVDYADTGSTAGRTAFRNGKADFAASDIPFQFTPEDGSEPERIPAGTYAYMPVTAGGTSFTYNLKINGQKVTNLRLSGENVAKIFTATITSWDDPAIVADNPGLAMPKRQIVPVVRADGSGSSAQFTRWMINQHGGVWNDYCRRSGRAPACGQTSFYPAVAGMISKSGDPGITGYVKQTSAEGSIGYVNYSYPFNDDMPVAKVLNKAGYYNEPTPDNVAVSLLKAQINQDQSSPDYLTQQLDGVYSDTDDRSYPLSSYSYLILPTAVRGQFDEAKGRTLGAFSYYAMCQAQEQSASLGYSPMPINLVKASFDQIKKIPGVIQQDIDVTKCKNPTFSADGTNLLAKNAKRPQDCDRRGPTQCATGTGGNKDTETRVKEAAKGTGPAGTGGTNAAGRPGATGAGDPSNPSDPSAVSGESAEVCDPETGLCTQADDGDGGELTANNSSSRQSEQALPAAELSASSGWSGTQTLILLVVLLTLVLVLAPGIVWRILSARTQT